MGFTKDAAACLHTGAAVSAARAQSYPHYSDKWRRGGLPAWDRCGTLHRASPCNPRFRRTLYRTQVRGGAAMAAGY